MNTQYLKNGTTVIEINYQKWDPDDNNFANSQGVLRLITQPFDITIGSLTDSVYWSQFAINPSYITRRPF